MAVRIEELQQDDLLTRYLDASRRRAAEVRPSSGGDLLLARYLRAMDRHGNPADAGPGAATRTCSSCGSLTHFDGDQSGGWAVCSVCDELA